MPAFSQYGVMRILRLVVAVAFMLLLLVSFSRGEGRSQTSNQITDTQISLQNSSDHTKHPIFNNPLQSVMTGENQTVAHSDTDQTDGQPAGTGAEKRSVLPPNLVEIGVDEHIGATISSPIYFTDSTGQQVDIRSLMKTPVLIVPVYFSCEGACTVLLGSIAGVLPNVQLTPNKDYRIIALSFDELETPELAARKKKTFMQLLHDSDPPFPAEACIFLTGSKQSIDTLMNEIGFKFKRVGNDFVHSVVLVTVTPEGKIVRYLYGININPFDITMALAEGDTAAPLLSVQRIARVCFPYHPEEKKYVISSVTIAGVMLLGFVAFLAANLLFGGKRKQKM